MSDTADLRAPLTELCKRAGVEKKNVKRITIDQDTATFEVYDTDAKGNQFLSPQTNDLAMADTVTVDIQF